MLRRTMDTAALAAAFPFTSPDLPRDPADPGRAARRPVRGEHRRAGPGRLGPVGAADNHNSVTLAASGAGKSYLAKLEILRDACTRAPSAGSSTPKTSTPASPRAVGGAYVHLGAPRRAAEPVRPARRRAGPGPDDR